MIPWSLMIIVIVWAFSVITNLRMNLRFKLQLTLSGEFRPYLLLGGIFVSAAGTKLTAAGRRHNALSDLSSVAPHPLFSPIQRNQISRSRTRTKIEITSVLSRLDIQISIHHIIYETNYFCSRVKKANCSVRSGFTKYQIASSSCGRLKNISLLCIN